MSTVTFPRISRKAWALLAFFVAAFLVLRVPLMYRSPGGRDEDWFAVPGITVMREGIPRVPYVPSRNPEGAFYRVDEALLALPPAQFYWQALFFWVLPAGYGTARLASAVAGLLSVLLLFQLGRRLYQSEAVGLWAAGLYSISRVFFFPATSARPDMLCTALGLAALLATHGWQTSGKLRYSVLAGALLGLGMLTHPFAIVYCVQVGLWVLFGRHCWSLAADAARKRRFGSAMALVGSAGCCFSLWLPLILRHRKIFEKQFFNNVLDRSGPGLFDRLISPWESLDYQARLFLDHVGVIQTVVMGGGLVSALLLAARTPRKSRWLPLILAISSIYLLIIFGGTHATMGYWSYPAALVFLCMGWAIVEAAARAHRRLQIPRWIVVGLGLLLIGAMLPGSGLRTWLAHARHWQDASYRRSEIVRQMLADLPPNARLAVDPAYVLDFYLAERNVILGVEIDFFFDATEYEYDYYVLGPYGREKQLQQILGGRLVSSYGDPHDIFACYAEIRGPPRAVFEKNSRDESKSSN